MSTSFPRCGDLDADRVRVIWIHGGGYTLGWKTQYGSGAGLVKASQAHGKTGVVYVAINYRLGLFVSPSLRGASLFILTGF